MASNIKVTGAKESEVEKVNAAGIVHDGMDNTNIHHHVPKYDAKGAQIGVMGDQASAHNTTFGKPQSQAKKAMADFSVEEVAQFLDSKGFGRYSQLFRDKLVSGKSFLKLDDAKLQKYGIDDEDHRENILELRK